MMIDVYTSIYDAITADAVLAASVAARVNLMFGIQDEVLPRMNYRPVSTAFERNFDDEPHVTLTFEVDVFVDVEGDNVETAVTLTDRLFSVLDNKELTATGWNSIHVCALDLGILSREENAHVLTSRWQLKATRD